MRHRFSFRWGAWLLVPTMAAYIIVQSFRDPDFWFSAGQRGDFLMKQKRYAEAARAYDDPWRAGAALYRNGDFETAAKVFARVPGASGAFDWGNALLMHGAYDQAAASYDLALGFRPGWKEAEENKALALARKASLANSGKDREKEAAEAYQPDETVFDLKKGEEGERKEMIGEKLSDEALKETWLRRVKTTPGDFLRAKFAFQAGQESGEQKGGDK